MRYEDITEEMWDKIDAEGIVVLELKPAVSFVSEYFKGDDRFVHTGNEVASDLKTVVEYDEGWTDKWVVVTRPESKTTDVPTTNPVVEWLDKYYYVTCTDASVGKIGSGISSVYLDTDHGDSLGSEQIVEFINNRYDLLQKEAKTNKQKELAEKRAKLLEELSAIDKELGGLNE